MNRATFIVVTFVVIANTSFAQTSQPETAYTPPHPFSPYADSYQYSVQKLYESLPKVNNTANIPGTTALVEAELKKMLSDKITWEKQTPQGKFWTGTNLLPIGKHKIEVRKLNTDYHFWFIYGKVQFFVHKNLITPGPAIDKIIRNYVIILYFNKNDAKANICYFVIEDGIIKNDTKILDKISNEASSLLAEANKKAYEEVKSRSEWTINGKTEAGTFDGYRSEKVILTKDNTRYTVDIPRFSYEDQVLIRGYIDHQGIPAR